MSASEAQTAGPVTTVRQGTFAVSDKPGAVMTTVLGSCVSACLHDPVVGIGGMNHILLPEPSAHASRSIVYGAQAMELLINALLKQGALKARMQAKLFGGARVLREASNIGAVNAAFALRFMNDEGIPCVAQSLGGTRARRIRFHPATGQVFIRTVDKVPIETRFVDAERKADVTIF